MPKKQYHIVKIDLKDSHLRSLADGKGLMLSGGMISENGHPIYLSAKQKNAIARKHAKGKKHTLKFDPDEYHQNIELQEGGALFKHIGRFIKNAGKKIGELYREHIRPTLGPALKEGVKKTIEKVIPKALTGITGVVAPEFAPAVAPLYEKIGEKASQPITDYIGAKTGAYGLALGGGIMIPPDKIPKAQVAPDVVSGGKGLIMGKGGNGLYMHGRGVGFPNRSVRDYRMHPKVI
jgi:hypothetical protein